MVPSSRTLLVTNYDMPADLSELSPETLGVIHLASPVLEQYWAFCAAKFQFISEAYEQHQEEVEDSMPLAGPGSKLRGQ